MEEVNGEAPLILLLFHLPVTLRYPCFHAIYPNTLSRFPSNKIPPAARPSPLASEELCKGLAPIRLIPPCSNPQENCTCSASSCLTWQG